MSAPLTVATEFTVRCLSPVHVGTEERLGGHDVLYLPGTLYRFPADRLLRELEQAREARDQYLSSGLEGRIAQWLQQGDRLRRLALYSSPVPRKPGPREDLRPFLADPLGRPYVPGTELKGAVRTAVLWHLVSGTSDKRTLEQKVGRKQNRRGQVEEEPDRKQAGKWLEQTLLGKDPHDDAFRLLRVTDTDPAPLQAVRVFPVLVVARNRDGLGLMQQPRSGDRPSRYTDQVPQAVANFCECLHDAELRTRVEVDRYLLSKWPRDAGFVERWAEACNAFSRHVAQQERAWWAEARAVAPPALQPLATAMVQFYDRLLHTLNGLQPGQVVLNLGWGGGWRTKTVAEAFGPTLVDRLVRRYNLDRRSGGRPFPKTRKVAWTGGQKFAPLGWVLLAPR